MTGKRTGRRAIAAVLTAVVLAVGLVALEEPDPAEAITGADFDPGLIISDDLFYDRTAMTAAQIQSFLDEKIGTCLTTRCLNVAVVPVEDRAPSYSADTGGLVCSAISGGNLRVSELIYRTQVACGISAKVILVTLQKEQGLVTSRAPSDWALRAAMGMGCPDTAPCNDAFAGLANQIISGTRQLHVYKVGGFARQPGVQYVQYHPNTACGGTTVNVRNYATAALYSYTPYQPNAAALANLGGVGDGCSSYGNRNFWRFYTQWFGPTTVLPCTANASREITQFWEAQGGASGELGGPVSPGIVVNGGISVGYYAGGAVFCTPRVGPISVLGENLAKYQSLGAAAGTLGYPIATRTAYSAGGVSGTIQEFQKGSILSSSTTGTHAVAHGPIRTAWGARGGSGGALGWPTGDQRVVATGVEQSFQRGLLSVFSDGTVSVLDGPIGSYWSTGSNSSLLGSPLSPRQTMSAHGITGVYQSFERGLVLSSDSTGTFAVLNGGVRTEWGKRGGTAGQLGWPVAEAQTLAGVMTQDFQFGTISVSGAGAATLIEGAILDYWRSGTRAVTLGAPTDISTALTANGVSGVMQNFENGLVLSSVRTGTFAVLHGAVRTEWGLRGGTGGTLGWPTGDQESLANGDIRQPFQGGTVTISSGSGLSGEIGEYWATGPNAVKLGRALGPASPLSAGGITGAIQNFAGGMVLASPSTGTFAVLNGPVRGAWGAQGGTGGALGWPTGDQSPLPGGGFTQQFQHGTAFVSPSGIGSTLSGEIAQYWNTAPNSSLLGFPTGVPTALNAGGISGTLQMFERAMVLSSSATGTHAVLNGAFRDAWGNLGGSGGTLGWPTGTQEKIDGGTRQLFERGTVVLRAGADAIVIPGKLSVYWNAAGNASLLGMPVSAAVSLSTGSTAGSYQLFDRGMALASDSTGTFSVLNGPIRTAWGARGGTGGSLGWPMSEQGPGLDGGVVQQFSGGLLQVAPDGTSTILSGPIYSYWSTGSRAERLGLPTGSTVTWTAGGVTGAHQSFVNAIVTTAPSIGTFGVFNGPIRTSWGAQGGSSGPLGWPVSDERPLPGGATEQRFQGGVLVAPADGPVVELSGEMFEYWSRGENSTALGHPTTSRRALSAGGVTGELQDFVNGLVLSSSTTGTHAVLNGPVRVAWGGIGGSAGPLGWPTSAAEPFEGGTRQTFQGGAIRVSADGAVTVE